jgi:pyruvate dehydrogenase E1 component alpha subunit
LYSKTTKENVQVSKGIHGMSDQAMVNMYTLSPKRAGELLETFGQVRALEVLERRYLIRAFEEKAEELYGLGKTHGTMHLSIGQEASAMGASLAVRSGYDYLLNHHRGHGHCIAWGGEVQLMMAEFMGKEAGYCRGRGGSMHIADVSRNNLGANGIVGGGVLMATGVGLGIKLRGTDQVCLGIFGDGAANTGPFHEALNMASIWDLPVIYLCENNQYAMSMAVPRAFNIPYISLRSVAYGIPGVTVDGNDFLAVFDVITAAAQHARDGQGPTLVESLTYRWRGHSKSDRNLYRTQEEIEAWKQRCPIRRFKRVLTEAGLMTAEAIEAIDREAKAGIDRAAEEAQTFPEPSPDNLEDEVYAP